MNGNKRIPSLENKRYYLWRYEKVKNSLSTLCYIEKDGQYLMLHRTVKKNDVNKDKWIDAASDTARLFQYSIM